MFKIPLIHISASNWVEKKQFLTTMMKAQEIKESEYIKTFRERATLSSIPTTLIYQQSSSLTRRPDSKFLSTRAPVSAVYKWK
jgi:hypothetical protein